MAVTVTFAAAPMPLIHLSSRGPIEFRDEGAGSTQVHAIQHKPSDEIVPANHDTGIECKHRCGDNGLCPLAEVHGQTALGTLDESWAPASATPDGLWDSA